MKQWFFILAACWSLSAIFAGDQSLFDICECSSSPSIQTQSLLKKLNAENLPPLDEASLKALQAMPVNIAKHIFPQIRKIDTIAIPGPLGSIKARFYFPRIDKETPLPVFVFFHGGGWALGTLDEYESICQKICYQTPCLVISVDYHLAPQYKFPEPLNDCYTATQWIAERVQQFGGDPNRLAIGGDSAGGNLAAAVTLMARDKKTPRIQSQVLIYPVLNHQFDTLSYFLFGNGYYLTRDIMQLFWKVYLRHPHDGHHPYASPLQALSLAQLPPALMISAEFDPLRDEGLAYAWRLHQDRVPVTLKRYNTLHGFINFEQELDVADQSLEEISRYLRQAFYSSK